MAIINLTQPAVYQSQTGAQARRFGLTCSDTFAQVIAAGYLQAYAAELTISDSIRVQSTVFGSMDFALYFNASGTLSLHLISGGNILVQNITVTATALASAGTVVALPSGGIHQYQILGVSLNKGGTNFSGGSGDRLLGLTDATTVFSVVPATNLQTLVNSVWGSTITPFPASAAISTLTAAGMPLLLEYSGGTLDYTAGSAVVTITAAMVA